MSIKRTVRRLSNGRIRVYTPNPYDTEPIEPNRMADMEYRLSEDVLFLRDMIRLLGITKRRAKEMDLSLNINTMEKLRVIAKSKDVSWKILALLQ